MCGSMFSITFKGLIQMMEIALNTKSATVEFSKIKTHSRNLYFSIYFTGN